MTDDSSAVNRLIGRVARLPASPRFDRYDAVLLAVPLLYASFVVVTHLLPVSIYLGLAAAGLLGYAVIADALFRNPPGPGGD